MPAQDRVVHLKQGDKVGRRDLNRQPARVAQPSETVCGKPMYTLGPEHSVVEHQDGNKITCPECLERYVR